MSLLRLEGVSAAYQGCQVLFGVDLAMEEGEVVALMGRNGMGKTTTIRAICGLVPISSGAIEFSGEMLAGMPAHRIAQLGIGLVPEGRRCFASLTVSENLVAAERSGYWNLERVGALFPKLAERRSQRASTLSGGEQQMLAIGRALMTNPRLLILDEATEGLAPLVRQEIWLAIKDLKHQSGLAILLVDKSLGELRRIADRSVILERGAVAWAGALGSLDSRTAGRLLGVEKDTGV